MGTELRVTVWTGDDVRAAAATAAVFREFDRLDAMMSVWKDGSDIVRLNAAAGERAVAVSAETREVLHTANEISVATISRTVSGSWNCARNLCQAGTGGSVQLVPAIAL